MDLEGAGAPATPVSCTIAAALTAAICAAIGVLVGLPPDLLNTGLTQQNGSV
jgi:hypothetical protein